MGSMEELEGRVTALETEMRSVRQDAAAARVLAGGADRDVATLTARMDAQTRLMQALRQTQVEDHAAIADIRRDVTGLRGSVVGMEGRVGDLTGDVAGLRRHVSDLAGDVTGLKGDVTEIKGDVGGLKGDVGEIRGGLDDARGDVAAIKGDVGEIRGGLDDARGDVAAIKGDIGELKVGVVNLARGQETIVELLRRRNGHE